MGNLNPSSYRRAACNNPAAEHLTNFVSQGRSGSLGQIKHTSLAISINARKSAKPAKPTQRPASPTTRRISRPSLWRHHPAISFDLRCMQGCPRARYRLRYTHWTMYHLAKGIYLYATSKPGQRLSIPPLPSIRCLSVKSRCSPLPALTPKP